MAPVPPTEAPAPKTSSGAPFGLSGLDRLRQALLQDAADFWAGGARRGRLRVRTLIRLRWAAVAGQTLTVLFVGLVLKFPLPWLPCFIVIGTAAGLNVVLSLASPGQRLAGDREAAGQIAFDILQLTGMLYLTGGTLNPFSLLLIAPVTLAAATLPLRHTLALGLLAVAANIILSIAALPLPSPNAAPFDPPVVNRIGAVLARIMGLIFTAGYAYYAAAEAARMQLALDTTHVVLAREQKLSALGALAAAAAHELGTPLATIAIVAKEMARGAAAGSQVREDAELLIGQADRCREILRRLTADPLASDAVHERMSLLQVVQEAIAPHAKSSEVRVEAMVSGPLDVQPPDIWRLPEVLHALTSFVENAVDFARSEVLVTARFDSNRLSIEVRDDGPGFAPEVLAKLGEPYVTSRPGAEGSRSGHVGMGLGFFIAKTLLERTGAEVDFRNGRRGGAQITAQWPRGVIEAPAATDPFTGLDEQ